MDSCRKYIKISSIINIVEGIAVYIFSFSTVYSAFLIILGLILLSLSYKDDYNLLRRKNLLGVIAFSLILINTIAAIPAIISWDKLSMYKRGVNISNAPPIEVNNNYKKIDILLKLGVFMVFVSGILFATTSWNFINDIFKIIALIVFGTLFIGLSYFSEVKLKIKNTTYMYWLLGIAFYFLVIVGILYFGSFSTYMSYNGAGRMLCFTITYFTLSGLLLATYLKFPKIYLLYSIYFSLTLTLYFLLVYLNLDNTMIAIIFSIIVTLINMFVNKDTKLRTYSKLVSYAIFVNILNTNIYSVNSLYFVFLNLINIVNFTYLIITYNNKDEVIVNNIIFYILFTRFLDITFISNIITGSIILLLFSIYFVLIRLDIIKVDDFKLKLNYYLYSLFYLIVLFSSSINSNFKFIFSLIYLGIMIFNNTINNKKIPLSKIILQIAIFVSVGYFINISIFNFSYKFITILSFTSLIYTLLHYFTKDKINYSIGIFIMVFLAIICNYNGYFISLFITLIPCVYLLFYYFNREDTYKNYLIFSYLLLQLNIYYIIFISNILDFNIFIQTIIYIWLLIIFILITHNEIIKKITYFIILVPIYRLICECNLDYLYIYIIESIMIIYITFLLNKFICRDINSKKTISLIGLIIALLIVIFRQDIIVGIYIGVIAIGLLFIGYNYKDYNNLFKFGVIVLIINIIYQLGDLWEQIPFWLYLLVGGLSIIGFVTYKEIKK